MERLRMPDNIRRHSLLVADVALLLARELCARHMHLNLELIEAAALLHDLGKAVSLTTREDHGALGAVMVAELGYEQLAPIVREHTLLAKGRIKGGIDESLIVNYADKRVMHDELVSVSVRLHDLADRYARTPEQRALLSHYLDLYQELEALIFADLPFGPDDVGGRLR
jgi:putative nucleotidyltransferase with HDIG domain